jgi:carboxypeptidase C (cathepsin A)
MRALVVYLILSVSQASPHSAPNDQVSSLPGWQGSTDGQFAGLVLANETRGANIFYYFIPCEEDPSTKPVVVWFQGGGGASPPWGNQSGPFAFGGFAGGGPSTFGLFNELGPYLTPNQDNGSWALKPNPNSWTKVANMLFLDQPVGVGYSYFTNMEDGYVSGEDELARDATQTLQMFFAKHPEYSTNPLYLFGESFAGHYVPAIASHILTLQASAATGDTLPALNLKGIGLGDGCPGDEHAMAQGELLHALGYADATQVAQFNAMVSRCKDHLWRHNLKAAFHSCGALTEWKQLVSGGIHDQDSRRYAHYASLKDLPNVDAAVADPEEGITAAYLDTQEVRAALNVPPKATTGHPATRNQVNTTRGLWLEYDGDISQLPKWPRLVSSLQVLLYNGNFDVCCSALGTERIVDELSLYFDTHGQRSSRHQQPVGESDGLRFENAWAAAERSYFTVNGSMAGYAKTVWNTTVMAVQGGGHLLPRDQPVRALAMLKRWLLFSEATDGTSGGERAGIDAGGGDEDRGDAGSSKHAFCDTPDSICSSSDVALASLGGRCALLYNCSGHGRCLESGQCACDSNSSDYNGSATSGQRAHSGQIGHGWTGADCTHAISYYPTLSNHTSEDPAAAPTAPSAFIAPPLAPPVTAEEHVELPAGSWRYHLLPVCSSSSPSCQSIVQIGIAVDDNHASEGAAGVVRGGLVLYAQRYPSSVPRLISAAALPSGDTFDVSWQLPPPVSEGPRQYSYNLNSAMPTSTTAESARNWWALGVFNAAKGFHAPTLNYTFSLASHALDVQHSK